MQIDGLRRRHAKLRIEGTQKLFFQTDSRIPSR
jgi:hypothetical protein